MSSKNYNRVEPWFGTWPPKMEQEKTDSRLFRIITKTRVILVFIFAVGLLLLWLNSKYPSTLLEGMSIAFIIAAVLGLTIDEVLKKELAKEAVKAALGYVLPEALKEEMRWVVGLRFLTIEYNADYDIQLNEDGKTARLRVEMTQRIKNFTDVAQDMNVGLSIDEMGIVNKPSKIEAISYHVEDDNWHYLNVSKVQLNEGAMEIKSEKVTVPSGKWVEIKSTFQETKQINDVHFMVFTSPVKKPVVNVRVNEGLAYRKGFTHRNPLRDGQILQGSLLPYQSMYVRWWPIV